MVGKSNFSKKIETQIVNPAIAKQSSVLSGTIIEASYAVESDLSYGMNGGGVVLQIIIYDDSSQKNTVLNDVPMVKIPGISISLPPMGSTAIIAFMNGNSASPVCIGILPTYTTNQYTTDHLSPTIPPKKLSK
jgi:hypothetical protein